MKIYFLLVLLLFCNAKSIETIAVLDIVPRGNITMDESLVLSDKLRSELFDLGVFKILEREQVDLIIKEQGFQQTGCTSTSCVVEVGQLLGVKKIITGTIGRIDDIYLMTLRMIDITTGEVIKNVHQESRGDIETVLTHGVSTTIVKLMNPVMPIVKNSMGVPIAECPVQSFKNVTYLTGGRYGEGVFNIYRDRFEFNYGKVYRTNGMTDGDTIYRTELLKIPFSDIKIIKRAFSPEFFGMVFIRISVLDIDGQDINYTFDFHVRTDSLISKTVKLLELKRLGR